nr:hypothetical protein [uncultured Neokomagataea sp.]
MLSSKVIHVDGVFLGTAIMADAGAVFRFYATHDTVRELHGISMPDLSLLVERARRLFKNRRPVLSPVPSAA